MNPPGLCEFGEEQGDKVLCHSTTDDCPYREYLWSSEYSGARICGREAAALAIAEQDQGAGR